MSDRRCWYCGKPAAVLQSGGPHGQPMSNSSTALCKDHARALGRHISNRKGETMIHTLMRASAISIMHNTDYDKDECPAVLAVSDGPNTISVKLSHAQLAGLAIGASTLEVTLRGISKPVQKERKRWFGRQ